MRCRCPKTCFIVGILGVLLALSLVLWMGCESDIPSKPEATEETTVYGAPPQDVIDRVMAIQDRHTPRLMAIPGVVGTATGLGTGGRPAVMVLTEKPGVAGIPGMLDGVPVIPKVTGQIRALKPPSDKPGKPKPEPPEPPVDPTARFDRPVPIGVSTGHPNITAGTIGCRVTDGTNVYALSNNHVYADENNAGIGDNVLQPGTYDGGVDPDDAIGTLSAFETIEFDGSNNTIDAAIALSSTANLGNATPSDGYGMPKSETAAAYIGQSVTKYGRTTSLTKGMVNGINATVDVGYDQRVARFVGQILIAPLRRNKPFSAGGDSGSLIVTEGEYKAVGLLFAGGQFVTVANPIDPVLSRFGVTIDGE
jgi:hypothetical protein